MIDCLIDEDEDLYRKKGESEEREIDVVAGIERQAPTLNPIYSNRRCPHYRGGYVHKRSTLLALV